MNIKKNIFLFKDVMFLKGVGLQTKKYLEKKPKGQEATFYNLIQATNYILKQAEL